MLKYFYITLKHYNTVSTIYNLGERSKDVLAWQRGHANVCLGRTMLSRINLPLIELLSEDEYSQNVNLVRF